MSGAKRAKRIVSQEPALWDFAAMPHWYVTGMVTLPGPLRALPMLVPDVTHLELHGGYIAPEVRDALASDTQLASTIVTPENDGTGWPIWYDALRLRGSAEIFAKLADLADSRPGEHFARALRAWRHRDLLAQWSDIPNGELRLAASIPETRVQRFAKRVNVTYEHRAPAV